MASGNMQPSIDSSEHISPLTTGDNIEAKKTANYSWDGSSWQRTFSGLVPSAFDYIAISYPSDTTEVYLFKIGGASGTTVATLTLGYVDNTKEELSSVART